MTSPHQISKQTWQPLNLPELFKLADMAGQYNFGSSCPRRQITRSSTTAANPNVPERLCFNRGFEIRYIFVPS